jgi:hypothetical protein
MINIPESAKIALKNDGYFFSENLFLNTNLKKVCNEIDCWKNVPAINGYGCLHHDHDALLQNLSLYSPAALSLILSEEILDFMEQHFGEKVLLSKIEYRRALVPKPKMPLHSDGSKQVLLFIYLNGVDEAVGMTAVMPGTHKIGVSFNDGSQQVPEQVQKEFGTPLIAAKGKPGSCLFFEANIWHCRINSIRPGREIIWAAYAPISKKNECLNLVFSRESLEGLSDRQMDALGLRIPEVGNLKPEDFRLSKKQSKYSLYLLSNKFIIQALINNNFFNLKQSIPKPLKKILRTFFKIF